MATLIPLNIRNGLAYMDMRAPIGNEFSELPHVVLTSDVDWDPKVLDCEFDPDEAWEDAQDESPFTDSNFDETAIICIVILLSLMPTLAIKNSLI